MVHKKAQGAEVIPALPHRRANLALTVGFETTRILTHISARIFNLLR